MSGIATWQMAVRDALADGRARTVSELATITGLEPAEVCKAAGKLILRGLLERQEIGCYRLTEAGLRSARRGENITCRPRHYPGHPRPRRISFRQRAWAAMRMQRKFSVPELLQLAACPEERGGSAASLHRYIRALERAGYVRRLRSKQKGSRPGSNGFVRWVLVRDTGPFAPRVRQDETVVDPNLVHGGRHDEAA